ncbi:MAG: class I SAM-dependent methyltransferase [Rhizobiaceae bacterium]
MSDTKSIMDDVSAYYTDKLKSFGNTPKGVDWPDHKGQLLRFDQLSKLFGDEDSFSVCDIGCGYGAFADYVRSGYEDAKYVGIDLSKAMVEASRSKFLDVEGVEFAIASKPPNPVDFCVASGIFNVRLKHSDEAWENWILESLDTMNKFSIRGFAFNALTSYSDKELMRPDLYYADSKELFDVCKRKYSRNVALLHDYDLYEFTILVRKYDG